MITNMFSKSFKSLFFLLLFVGFSSAFAKPYPGPQGAADIINERQANQDKRIAAGKAAGQISPQEEAQLNQMVEFINNAERQANKSNKNKRINGSVKVKGSGNIDAAEFHEIMGMLDLLSDRIRISRAAEDVALAMPNAPTPPAAQLQPPVAGPSAPNVAQGKQPYPGPQRAADIINERQANQDKRIAAGKAAGQISPQEEAQLRQMADFINNAERQANKGNQAPRQMGGIKAPGSGNIDPAEFDKLMSLLDQLSNKIQISSEAEAVAVRMPTAPTASVAGPTAAPAPAPGAAAGWTPMPGAAVDIGAAGAGQVWVTNKGQNIYRWVNNNWTQMPGAAVRVAVDPSGNAWVVNAGGGIYKWENNNWRQIPGALTDIGVGGPTPNGTVWGVNAGQEIFRLNGTSWEKMPGAAVRVAVDPAGNAWVVNSGGGIYTWVNNNWVQRPGAAKDVAVCGTGAVYVIGTDNAPYKWNGTNNWDKQPGGPLLNIACDGTGRLFATTPTEQIGVFTP